MTTIFTLLFKIKDYCIGIVLAIFFSFSFAVYANPNNDETEQSDCNTCGDDASLAAINWDARCDGSDYYMYIHWEGLSTAPCQCGWTRYLYIYRNNTLMYTIANNNASGVYSIPVGPLDTSDYKFNISWSGRNKWWGISCVATVSCSGSDNGYTKTNRSTVSIKAPASISATDNTFDDYVHITWKKGTDIPNSQHGYKIYRDSVLIYTSPYNLSSYEFYDSNATPEKVHYYEIVTYTNEWMGLTSPRIGTNGRKFGLGVKATRDRSRSCKITWNSPVVIGATSLYLYRSDGKDDRIELGYYEKTEQGTLKTDEIDNGNELIPGYEYYYIVQPYNGQIAYNADSTIGGPKPDGLISGEVKAPFGGGIDNVIVSVKLLDDNIPQGDTSVLYCDTTDGTGVYSIKNIYYHEGADFKVVPKKDDHLFSPSYQKLHLQKDPNYANHIDFTDTSSFTISGRVVQVFNGDTCPVSGVEMLLDDVYKGVKTNANGYYYLAVEDAGFYTIQPRMEGRSFLPSITPKDKYDKDTSGIDFIDTTRHLLQGVMMASCDIFIGQADIRIYSYEGSNIGCFDTTLTTTVDSGYFGVRLPARKYNMELVKFESTDLTIVSNEDVETYFPTLNVDLSDGDSIRNMIYRKSPEMQVSGFEDIGCGPYQGVPLLEQGMSYNLRIDVTEKFGEDSCYADAGYVVVFDGTVDNPTKIDTIYLENGVAHYSLVPGEPNLISPHLKLIEIVAHVDDETDLYSQEVLVTGSKPRDKTFVTVSPEVPFMILRDPPGDGSYSYLEKATTYETALRFSAKMEKNVTSWAEVKAGTKFSAGLCFTTETEIWGKVKGSLTVGASLASQTEFKLSITNGEQFNTSNNSDVTGKSGDVFAGFALNILYALTDVINYNQDLCKVEKTTSIMVGADGFKTTFIYTEDHIRNTLIPQLEEMRNVYVAKGSDSAKLYDNQINVWKQTLKINDNLKKKATFVENRSFSAGSEYQSYQEITKEESLNLEFSMFIELGVALEAGIEVGGVGASGGVESKFKIELGAGGTFTHTSVTKTGYVLNDDDMGDFFSVDILKDKVYGTPVFNLVSGRSSCPWEENTQPREGVQLTSDTYNQFVNTADGQGVFKLTLGNLSQSNESRSYNLLFLQQSNPDAAKISLGGSQVQGGVPTPYTIEAFQSVDATVTVERGPIAFDYNDLQFRLYSGCDDDEISDTISLNVSFYCNCSEISIGRPETGWFLNSYANNRMLVKLEDYDLTKLDRVRFQYGNAGSNSWKTLMLFEKDDLNDAKTEFIWNTEDITDGKADIRAVVECGEGLRYSKKITGMIDRMAPMQLGLPQPSDGVLSKGDVMSVTFNETINRYKVSSDNLHFENLSTSEVLPVVFGCSEDRIIMVPEIELTNEGTDTFMVAVTNIEDIYGNIMTDTIRWTFTNSDPTAFIPDDEDDTDEDGLLNKEDNCILSANLEQEDMDNDSIGDACDPDIDGDFIVNETDNCPLVLNAEQEDMDLDGIGDACDDDIDGDGVANATDNCPTTANPDQTDENANNIGDDCEIIGIENPIFNKNEFMLFDNYPNPFSESTVIQYYLPIAGDITLTIYNSLGQVVTIFKESKLIAGMHETQWLSKNVESGMYFYSLQAKNADGSIEYYKTKKMMLIH